MKTEEFNQVVERQQKAIDAIEKELRAIRNACNSLAYSQLSAIRLLYLVCQTERMQRTAENLGEGLKKLIGRLEGK